MNQEIVIVIVVLVLIIATWSFYNFTKDSYTYQNSSTIGQSLMDMLMNYPTNVETKPQLPPGV